MKAAIYHEPIKITTEEVPVPKIGAGDIMIKVHACGICGSDLHMYRMGAFAEGLCRLSEGGMIPGHEFGGEVVEAGPEVEGIVKGDRVSAFQTFGAMAEYVPVSQAKLGLNVFKLPPEVSYREAATLEPMANSIHATRLGNPEKGQNIVIFGAGIIGLGIAQSLQVLNLGLNKTIMVDVSDKRLELARELGMDAVIHAGREDVYQKVTELIGEVPITQLPYANRTSPAVDVIYDCVGYIQERPEPPVIQQALLLAKEFGRVVMHGAFEAPVTLSLMPLVVKQLKVFGSYAFVPDEVGTAIEWMRDKKVDRMKIITQEFPLEQAKEAFDRQCQSDYSIKVLITP